MVESQPSKLLVAGSIPVSRSIAHRGTGCGFCGVEHESTRAEDGKLA